MVMHPLSATISMAPPPETLPGRWAHEPKVKKIRINSKNTNFEHFITKKKLFSPLIGNIRLSLHTYINSFSSLFVLFFCCRWDIFWFSSIVRIDLNFLERNLYLRGNTLTSMTSEFFVFISWIKCGGILLSSLLCISNTIETIVSPNLDRLNLFVKFLCSLTGLKDFLVIFRAMTQSWFLIGGLEAKKDFHWLIHVVEGISLWIKITQPLINFKRPISRRCHSPL